MAGRASVMAGEYWQTQEPARQHNRHREQSKASTAVPERDASASGLVHIVSIRVHFVR